MYFENQLLTLISSAGESISGATPSAYDDWISIQNGGYVSKERTG